MSEFQSFPGKGTLELWSVQHNLEVLPNSNFELEVQSSSSSELLKSSFFRVVIVLKLPSVKSLMSEFHSFLDRELWNSVLYDRV